ncbi:uncharacterized protein GGS22DRAFT_75358 [Annulohypoxylon maeteangense]|uniref:uncharacterized protein n=1 Tax=Annulohypoxylon maeteangense TaxID=1927788 RepID=UPI0020079262|nr:uncharacterized protein GGS22DRAFT_75358 [Annulohypoxylon maeteangense]KAI0881077.1 hypothetical protein GGS22DRAFT_75358 [Annulohypoxylon maeteangense]
MVSVRSILTSALSAASLSSAYITGVTAPDSAKAGTTVTATLTASIYIQNWSDFGIVWGIAPARINCGDVVCVGQQIAYTNLYPDNQPKPGKFNIDVALPSTLSAGDYQLVAAVPYLVGASGLVSIQSHTANITITA